MANWPKRRVPADFPDWYSKMMRIGVSQFEHNKQMTGLETSYRGTREEMLERADHFRHFRKTLRDNPSHWAATMEAEFRFRMELEQTDKLGEYRLILKTSRRPKVESFRHLLGESAAK